MASNTWTTTTSSNWTTSGNWTGGSVPTTTDDVLVHSAASAAYNLTYNEVSDTIHSLTLTDAHVTMLWSGTDALTVSTFTTLNTGTLKVSTAGATFNTGTLTVSGGTFNQTLGTATDSGALTLTTGSILQSGGTLSAASLATSSTGVFNQTGGSTSITGLASFANSGAATLSGTFTTGTLAVTDSMTIGGTVTTTSGGGGASVASSGKTITMSSGSVLDATFGGLTLNSGTLSGVGTVKGAVTNSGGGTIKGSGGTLDFTGNVSTGLTWSLAATAGSTLEFNGTATAAGAVAISSATQTLQIGSGGVVTLGALESITNGTILMSGGSLSDSAKATLGTSSTLTGFGTFNPIFTGTNTGTVDGKGGVLDLTANIAVTGIAYKIDSSASSALEVDGTVATGNTFTFVGASNDLIYNNAAALTTTVAALNVGTSNSVPTNFIDFKNHTVSLTGTNSFTGTSATLDFSDGSVLTVTGATGSTGGTWFVDIIGDGGSGSNVFLSTTAICYAAGTRILTPTGEMAVEDIVAGDLVVTLVGDNHVTQPVRWVGERPINIAAHPRPELVAPVRIRRGAFGGGLPQRDLVVSPDHCMFIDGKLIPAKLLINDMTIVQHRDARSVHYFHVELDRHALLLAEGLPAESYLDTGNRAYFANSGLAMILHPEFHVNAGLKCWEEDACAPLAVSAAAVEPVWQALAARAEAIGYTRPTSITTDDADLRLVADGRVIRPVSVHANRHVFVLPAGASDVRLASRAAIPSDTVPYLDDWRRLGVAVKRIVIRSDSGVMDIPADHPALTEGWYKAERDSATIWRWMDGDARLPILAGRDPISVEVHVGITTAYKLHESAAAEPIAA
jgi:Hint domain